MARAVQLVVANTNVISDGREAWIDSKVKRKLGLSYGDVIEIKAVKKSTVAVVWEARMGEGMSEAICLDDLMRHTLSARSGDKVSVKKVVVKSARSLWLRAPRGEKISAGGNFAAYVKGRMKERPVIVGDIVPVSVAGVMLTLTVSKVDPKGIVKITDKTDVVIR